ncbi:MAG TPA: LL-diaminopimelate aminotransferase, partial [Clostridia bacterium]|nr:LL-diaminopimelate aminotransferase [Clostridia bacterium]
MFKANANFLKMKETYLFTEIARRVESFAKSNPSADIIRLGIGDVTLPLPQVSVAAMQEAVREMGNKETFRGYGPEQGYAFLREAIAEHDYKGLGIEPDEIIVSDGAKSDTANFTDMFGRGNIIAIPNPVYPVYMDSNIISGTLGDRQDNGFGFIRYLDCLPENGFKAQVPDFDADIIYLCSPNNPTGSALTKSELKAWVEYARERKALILFDSAYERYIIEPDIPHSIYEIDGAKEVAVEFRSFSKTAGFTGTRCAYTVVPQQLTAHTDLGEVSLNKLWIRRQSTKFNGVPYIVQRGALALYSEEGQRQIEERIAVYMENARNIKSAFESLGYMVWGGVNAPYIWIKVPEGMDS